MLPTDFRGVEGREGEMRTEGGREKGRERGLKRGGTATT